MDLQLAMIISHCKIIIREHAFGLDVLLVWQVKAHLQRRFFVLFSQQCKVQFQITKANYGRLRDGFFFATLQTGDRNICRVRESNSCSAIIPMLHCVISASRKIQLNIHVRPPL